MNESATLDAPAAVGLEGRVEAFEAALAAGGSVDLARFLPPPAHPDYLGILCELVRIDLEAGWSAGNPKRLAEYRAQFPELFARRDLADAVAFEERRLRARHGPCDGAATARVGVPAAASVSSDDFDSASGSLPAVGDEFLGFRLVGELGRGSFGRVYLAHQHILSDRPVALKVTLRPNREAQHLARLQHTNIVPVLSVHQSGDMQAVCMPYYGRTTLRQVLGSIRRHDSLPASGEGLVSTLRASARDTIPDEKKKVEKPLPLPAPVEAVRVPGLAAAPTPTRDMLARLGYVDAVVWLGARLADGLAHAHERGILHRDLKPENVLLADDGQPMLLDFNLADDAAPGEATNSGGTLLYMAPEHIDAFTGDRTRPVDARSDLYALGLVLYELLTARHPSPLPPRTDEFISAVSPMKALRDARGIRPDPVRKWNPAISPAVDAVVSRLLDPDPARRYQTARHLQEDLERHLANLPLKHGREPSLRERARKFARRHPRALPLAGLTAAVALAAVLGGVVIDRTRGRARAEAAAVEARETAEARTRYVQFHHDFQDARVLLAAGASDLATRAAGVARARAAIALYGDGPEWDAQPGVSRLGEPERNQLRAEVGEALFLLSRATPADESKELAGRAEKYLATADPRARAARDAYLDGAAKAVAGRWADAVPPLERAHRLDPQHLAAAFTLGYSLQALGRDAEALEYYRACVVLRPDFPWSYLNRGVVYLQRGDAGRALADFDDAIRRGPTWGDAYFARGTLYQQVGKYAEALADYDRAEMLKSPRARLYLLRSQVKEKLNDSAGAAKDRAKAFATPPADEFDHLAFGMARLPAEPEKALAEFDRALALNPRSLVALQNRAHVLAEHLNRGPDAIKSLDQLVQQYPTFAKAWGGRAVLHARLGDRAAAHRDATECLRRDTDPRTLYQLAGVYALTSKGHSDDRREALHLLAKAFTAGFRDFATLDGDTDLDALRADKEFIALVKEFRPAPPTSEKK